MDRTALAARTADRDAARRLMGLRRLGGRPLILAIAAPLLAGALLVVQAWLLAGVLGGTIEAGTPLSVVLPMIAGIGVILAIRAGLGVLGEQAGQVAAERIKGHLRAGLFGRILAEPRPLGMAPASGAVGAALVDRVEALEPFFARYLPALIGAATLPVAFAVIVLPLDWVVALLFLCSAPVIPVFMALAGWGAQAATDRQAKAFAQLSGYFADRLRGLTTLKLFGRAEASTAEVHAASEDLRRRTNAVLRIAFLSSAILEFFAALGVAGVALYVGLTFLGYLPINPGLTLTAGLFCLLMAPEVYQPLRLLAAHHHDRAAAKSALAEIETQVGAFPGIAATVDTADPGTGRPSRSDRNEATPEPAALGGGRGPGALAISGLTVTTPDGRPVLDHLDLHFAPGEVVAVMGESGIGKSTLIRAAARLIPIKGAIALDGADLAAMPEDALRRRIACIAQKPRIVFGTIADNIRFAREDADEAEIRAAARRAGVTAFAELLPDGLSTPVGEGGLGLSGGEAQRVALARLFLRDPDLILLDEPTAHLDAATEALVLDEILRFAGGRTVLIATHSASVAARADRVLRLAGGRLLPMPHRRPATFGKRGAA